MIDEIVRLGPRDLPDCLTLAQDRDWGPEDRKWGLLLEVGEAYGLRDPELVGTTILTRYGTELAAISMVLVASRYGRRGLGTRMMAHALDEAGDAITFLNATEYGRPVYERLGFVTVGATHTHLGPLVLPPARPGSRPAEPGDVAAILALDAEVNGVERTHLVPLLPGFCEQLRVVEKSNTITGYAGAWRTVGATVIGPVIAATEADAMTLIADLAASVEGPFRLDLDARHPRLIEWASEHGAKPWFDTALMVRGDRPLPGDRSRWFVPVMQALG
ncbi:GNAT superfamily N-acetyltransferase [Allocatelliglobosispora scoriae]|uniref:GNAT superfamily N-acetyltransferase n=1 Tax=Allocatelliglobosispora scoriae TaxID=643052 RepID=A0A841BFT0_9ACTN|nr:GNAT family N-acetyltransferase [Allocatelliglobosispora scoriae]MBB5867144.1 GNAT superfamily N-acetyltransferase [Allocatelliglobosispora scoriae]